MITCERLPCWALFAGTGLHTKVAVLSPFKQFVGTYIILLNHAKPVDRRASNFVRGVIFSVKGNI